MKGDHIFTYEHSLSEYKVPAAVVTYEIAFARTAIAKDAVRRILRDESREKINLGIEQFVEEALIDVQATEEVLHHYANEKLNAVAIRTIRFYERNAFPLNDLVEQFAGRVSAPSKQIPAITLLFEQVAAEAERLIKFGKSARSIRELLDHLNGVGG